MSTSHEASRMSPETEVAVKAQQRVPPGICLCRVEAADGVIAMKRVPRIR